MKKFLIIIGMLVFLSSKCWAYEIDLTKDGQYQQKIMQIGFSILNANKIEKRIVFRYLATSDINASAIWSNKSVNINNGIIIYVEDDAELAGVISHEIAHNLDFYDGWFNGLFKSFLLMTFSSKKYEKKADLRAIDFMVKAGYNPVAFIIQMNKCFGERPHWWILSNMFATHPQTSKRLAYVYEYIYEKYPQYLVNNEYRENIYYQNFLLTSKKIREKIRGKHMINVSNTTKQEQENVK
jgi:predicted Zn-dependent protease